MQRTWFERRYIVLFGAVLSLIFTAGICCSVYWQKNSSQQKKIMCSDNLRKLGTAMLQYAVDYDDILPDHNVWHNAATLWPKINPCLAAAPMADVPHLNSNGVPGYAMNDMVSGRRTSLVAYPKTTVLICETAAGIAYTSSPNPYETVGMSYPEILEKGWLRHNGGSNYLFCDGHVKWLKENSVSGYKDDHVHSINNGVFASFAFADTHWGAK
jgi:prepilin-type processing-associated H-X9-DG protein